MTNKFQVNVKNLSSRNRVSFFQKMQETQQQKKQFRSFQMMFQTNLDKFIRNNKQGFDGAVQIPANKSNINPEEYEASNKTVQKMKTYIQRLTKGMLLRNDYLCKQQTSYQQGYRESGVTPAFQNPQNGQSNKPTFIQNIVNLKSQQTWQGQGSCKNLPKVNIRQFRPLSATIQNSKFQVRKSKERRDNIRAMSSRFSRQGRKRNTISLKNVNIHNVKIEKDTRKASLLRKGLAEITDFQKQQVFISKKIALQNAAHQNSFMRLSKTLYNKKAEKGGMIKKSNNLHGQNQYLNFIQRQRLQSKIITTNTVLAFNLNQGYKAKSKCWANPGKS